MIWQNIYSDFKRYLQFERGLSDNTIDAYLQDISKLMLYCDEQKLDIVQLSGQDIQNFLRRRNTFRIAPATQGSWASGLKAFANDVQLDHHLAEDPTDRIEAPKAPRDLPDVLSLADVGALIGAIDQRSSGGTGNMAVLQVVDGC